jgi:hypothetical protein
VSRSSLVDVYISSLPFSAVAIVAVPGGGCRVAVGGEIAPGETTIARYFFKPLHIELLLGAAGLNDAPINQSPDSVAALLEKAARSIGPPYETDVEIRAAAERQVDAIVERVKASNQSGGLKEWNAAYKQYRQAQIAKCEKAIPYSAYLQRVVIARMVRDVATTGRMV